MSKVANAVKMIILLKSRGKMKASELANELEVDERMVRRYKDDLEQAQIYIDSIPGKYGGYVLQGRDYLLSLNLAEEELDALITAKEHLENNNFILSKEYNMALDKINAAKKESVDLNIEGTYFVKETRANYDFDMERKIWIDVKAAIITRNKIKISYSSLEGDCKSRMVRPYSIFQYKGAMYLVGYCEYRNDIREFKLSRIKQYEVLEDKFIMNNNFKVKDYMKNCFGIFNDEEIFISLKVKYPMAQIVKEKIWVDNQEIIEIKEDNSIIFRAKMKGLTEIKSWILSMGSNALVLEPESLREEIKEELKKGLNLYD
ncbi:helix-turn-helix transcriptional regulator [Clostridium peptidivorans]|uniref:helix-turn-helix transcriptional regulator n=1 Tax=Clostridium peptidivorans TaxID=100174 RepID=UPI000BE221D3|nr:transcriptional regulator [Clostridium peptidivorans]